MNALLPPRRTLPPEIKERMRPTPPHSEPAKSGRAPLAVAAAVVLLAAGGVFLTQGLPKDDAPQPASALYVIPPTNQELARCRTALEAPSWTARTAVALPMRALLVGTDNRFCELGRSTATTSSSAPLDLDGGTVAFRSPTIVAGVPAPGSSKLRASSSGEPLDSLWTKDLFVVDTLQAGTTNGALSLEFGATTRDIPWTDLPQGWTVEDSSASGDTDPWSPRNVLARCLDNALVNRSETGLEPGWEPVIWAGLDVHDGVLLARQSTGDWGTCQFTSTGGSTLTDHGRTAQDTNSQVIDSVYVGGSLTVSGVVSPQVESVELTLSGTTGARVTPVNGGFVAQIAAPPTIDLYSSEVRLVLRFAGGLTQNHPLRP